MADELMKPDDPTGIMSLFQDADDQRPDFIAKGDKTGTEGITHEDIRLPRIAIAQGLSPEVLPGPERIKGLEVPDMFNDFTKHNYKTGPIYFIPIRRDKRCIEFKPRADGGGVVDLNVPWNDKRATEWRKGPNGENLPPVATRFNEWVVLMILNPNGDTEPAIISIKMTNKWNREAAEKQLNGFIKYWASQEDNSVPIYGRIYKMTSRTQSNSKGTFGVPMFESIRFVPKNEAGRRMYKRAEDYAAAIRGKATVAPREPGDEEFEDGQLVDEKTPF